MKTMVCVEASVFPVDTISHEGGLWLVTQWIQDRDTKEKWPARLIRLDVLPSYRILGPGFPADYSLGQPIPKGIFDGSISPEKATGYEVIDSPLLKRPDEPAN